VSISYLKRHSPAPVDILHSYTSTIQQLPSPEAAEMADTSKDMRQMYSLTGRNYIVTGGGQGIGFAITRAICEMGGNVAVLDLRDQPVDAFKDLSKQFGVKAEYLQTDVTKEESLTTSFEKAVASLGSLDGLVPAAGIVIDKPFVDQTWEEVSRIQQVNVRRLCCHPLAPMLMHHRSWAPSLRRSLRSSRYASRTHLAALC